MRKLAKTWLLLFMSIFLLGMTPAVCHAETLDDVNNEQQQESDGRTGDEGFDSISDYMKGYNAVDSEDMQKASKMTNPITNFIGTLTGIVLLLTMAGIGLVTALDLMYIAIPFTRRFLNPANLQSGGGMMPGMGMGRGMGMGMGGMGMGMGGAQQGGADPNAHKWVSDEAVAAVMGGAQQGGQPQQGMGMGMGMQQQQQPVQAKQAISVYLKKRIFFIIVFAVASTLLLSSIFTDCGLNLAKLAYKVLEMLNEGLGNVQV